MARYQVFREKATGKIAAVYDGCRSNSVIFKDKTRYDEFETDEQLKVEVEPAPDLPKESEIEVVSPNGTKWKLKINNAGKLRVEK